jgi:hypothetical protein
VGTEFFFLLITCKWFALIPKMHHKNEEAVGELPGLTV